VISVQLVLLYRIGDIFSRFHSLDLVKVILINTFEDSTEAVLNGLYSVIDK